MNMTTYHVVSGWVDEDGQHDIGDTIDLGDEGLDALKIGYLTRQGHISLEKPTDQAEEAPQEDEAPKAHRARKGTKKTT